MADAKFSLLPFGEKGIASVISRLEAAGCGEAVELEGTWGSFTPFLAGLIHAELGRPVLLLSPHTDQAENVADDLHTFTGKNVSILAPLDVDSGPGWGGEAAGERLRLVLEILEGREPMVISASAAAICQPVPGRDEVLSRSIRLEKGGQFGLEQLLGRLVDDGFERCQRIDMPGQYACRGGIVDIYPVVASLPAAGGPRRGAAVRVEFYGEVIESIRTIEIDELRSQDPLDSVSLFGPGPAFSQEGGQITPALVPPETIVILAEPAEIQEAAEIHFSRSPEPGRPRPWAALAESIRGLTRLSIRRFGSSGGAEPIRLEIGSLERFRHSGPNLWEANKRTLASLLGFAREGGTVDFYCQSEAEKQRVAEIIEQIPGGPAGGFRFRRGFLHCGFVLNSIRAVFAGHNEIFGRRHLPRGLHPARLSAPVESLSDLHAGDYVVHLEHGIGRYRGTKIIKEGPTRREYLSLEFADGVRLQVSTGNIGLVHKYIGTTPRRPKLAKLGSKKWKTQTEKVSTAVREMAAQLLQMQARREAMGGIAYGNDTDWQCEFEGSFGYQETPDQLAAMEQIKSDMARSVAMDRLLCGDVGYGKTELAMRAAFKVIESGRQVAVLVPTTILSVQHCRTFQQRFADFPVSIDVLNRFRSDGEAAGVIERAKSGRLDVLIGTHRLLSRDVGFAELGLVIIDEEQRFGVEHKERLKKMRFDVEVLTMTATPIPRTLHMALLGLRQISSLATPPLDRRSIATSVRSFSPELLARAVSYELERGGQVFFVHNRVHSIGKRASQITGILERGGVRARVGIAHGQMASGRLEEVMLDFINGRIDVLVCTTIIESGLDIPNANTIFIDDADRFGLAELHQLRGRVGRYRHRAYAYMLLPRSRSVTPAAAKRLKAIEDYSSLGAGFRIALRDLEIRGAGNILGPEQSGHIQLVGYQLYCDLLARAVAELGGRPDVTRPKVVMDLPIGGRIPESYVPNESQRMELYRRIAASSRLEEIEETAAAMADIYGALPAAGGELLDAARLKLRAGSLGIRRAALADGRLLFEFENPPSRRLAGAFKPARGESYMVDARTLCLRLPPAYFEPPSLMAMLGKIFSASERLANEGDLV